MPRCVHFRLHFSCYGVRSVMLQINEYDDDDDEQLCKDMK